MSRLGGAAIVTHHAAAIVPAFKCLPDAPRGKLVYLDETRTDVLKPGDMVLCRLRAPLVGLLFDLLASGQSATILGSEIGEQLIKVLNKVRKRKRFAWEHLLDALEDHQREYVKKYLDRHDEVQAAMVRDQCAALQIIIERAQARDYEELVDYIKALFSDKSGKDLIVLSTVHKAKGLEAERVFILRPDVLPFTWLKMSAESAQQEENLDYVARTRAKDTLVYFTNKKFRDRNRRPLYAQTDFDDIEWPDGAIPVAPSGKPVELNDADEPVPSVGIMAQIGDMLSDIVGEPEPERASKFNPMARDEFDSS